MPSGFDDEGINAFDLVINALKAHEKQLDEISERLDEIAKRMEILLAGELYEKNKVERTEEQKVTTRPTKMGPTIICTEWRAFKETCLGSRRVTFQIAENSFQVHAISNGDIFRYAEDLPNQIKIVEDQSYFSIDKSSFRSLDSLQFLFDRRLKCGLSLLIKSSIDVSIEKQFLIKLVYNLDVNEVKKFLSNELGVSIKEVVEGRITY